MIPKLLHQIWLGPKPRPLDMLTWEAKHPSWRYHVWTIDDARVLGMQNAELFEAFDGIYHAQADILRYEILYKHGGVYVDADSECLREIDDLVDTNIEAFAVRENENDPPLLMNSFLGTVPGTALYKGVLDELGQIDIAAIRAEDKQTLHGAAWVLTGPACFSEVVHRDKHQIEMHPGNFFATNSAHSGVYGRHWQGTTYRTYKD